MPRPTTETSLVERHKDRRSVSQHRVGDLSSIQGLPPSLSPVGSTWRSRASPRHRSRGSPSLTTNAGSAGHCRSRMSCVPTREEHVMSAQHVSELGVTAGVSQVTTTADPQVAGRTPRMAGLPPGFLINLDLAPGQGGLPRGRHTRNRRPSDGHRRKVRSCTHRERYVGRSTSVAAATPPPDPVLHSRRLLHTPQRQVIKAIGIPVNSDARCPPVPEPCLRPGRASRGHTLPSAADH